MVSLSLDSTSFNSFHSQVAGRGFRAGDSGKTTAHVIDYSTVESGCSIGAELCKPPSYEAFFRELSPETIKKFYGELGALNPNPHNLIALSKTYYLMSLNASALRKLAHNPKAQEAVNFYRTALKESGLLGSVLNNAANDTLTNPFAARELIALYPSNTANDLKLAKIWLENYPTNIGPDGEGIPNEVINRMKEAGTYIEALEEAVSMGYSGSHETLINALVDKDIESANPINFKRIKELLKPQKTVSKSGFPLALFNLKLCSEKLSEYIDKFGMSEISQAREKVATSYSAESKQALIAVLNSWNLNGQFNEQIESLEAKATTV